MKFRGIMSRVILSVVPIIVVSKTEDADTGP
jgi:hypothetical protein